MHHRNRFFVLLSCLSILTLIAISPLSAQEETPEAETTVNEEVPTEAPPAEVPTDVPTDIPTDVPTEIPTIEATEEATEVPTEVPTIEATEEATEVPTEVPTIEATEEATEVPTAEATEVPTEAPVLVAPVFNLEQSSFETSAGLSLVIDLSVSDDNGIVRVVEDASATLGGVSISAASEASADESGYSTAVSVTYLAPADYAGADSFSLMAVDMTGESASVVISVNVAAVETTEEALLEVPEDTVQAAMTYTVNSAADTADFSTADGLCDVDDVTAGSQCTLRAAIEQANVNVGTDTIKFALASPYTIEVGTIDLPQIIQTVNITGTLGKAILDGTGTATNGLFLGVGSDGSKISGLVINNFTNASIEIVSSNNNVISGNYLGLNATGTAAAGNGFAGVYVESSSNNVIGGATAAARNVISGNGIVGVIFNNAATNNIVAGNYIGTDKTGKVAIPNGAGITISDSSSNTIGGDVAGERNLISGNNANGVSINGDSANNTVSGNYIGVDVSGKLALGNDGAGIGDNTTGGGTVIGGDSVGERNIISGNFGDGVNLDSSGATVMGNYIGTDMTGTKAIPNVFNGIGVASGAHTIGGDVAAEGNLISGNFDNGIGLFGGSSTVISGNTIGTVAAGNKALGNEDNGILVQTTNNTIGGDTAGERNLISGNFSSGVFIEGDSFGDDENIVSGNYIGSDKTGKKAIGNFFDGITIQSSQDNLIGGDTSAEANLIFGNGDDGIGTDGSLNIFSRNSIFSNGGLGIFHENPITTATITTVTANAVSGEFSWNVGDDYRVEVFSNATCDSSGSGEGQTFLGQVDVPNGTGTDTFNLPLTTPLKPGAVITVTLTNLTVFSGVTSAFSECAVFATTAPKAKPSLILPANNAIFYDGAFFTFVWKSTALADRYRLELATDKNFSNVIFFEDIPVAATELFLDAPSTLGDVLEDGDYYWRVRGGNSVGNGPFSAAWKFTVNSNSTPSLTKPANDSVTSDNTPTFSWKALAGAKGGYSIFWIQGFAFDCSEVQFFGEGDFTTKTSYTPLSGNELSEGLISWCVQAYDSQGNASQFSDVWSFNLTLLKAPLDSAVTTDTTPTFSWNKAPGTGVTYRLLVDDEPTFSDPLLIDLPGLTKTSFTPLAADALDASSGYFWRVEVTGGSWTVADQTAWEFFIAPAKLIAPVLVAPTNGATNVDAEALELDWNPVAAISGVNIQYEIWVSTSPAFTNRQSFFAFPGDDFVDISFALNPSTRYYWKVRAVYVSPSGATGYGPFSQTRNFTTGT